MAMNFRPISILRWSMPVLLCAGLFGLGGCSSRYHSQHASAIGGGHIGKGPVGKGAKKRGGFGPSADLGIASTATSDATDPFGGLGETKLNKSGPSKGQSLRSSAKLREPRAKPDAGLFDTGPRAPRQRASDPFNNL